MKLQLPKAETSVILNVFIQDSSLTTGAGLSGLDESSSITGGYIKRNGTGVALAVDQDVTTEGTYEAPSTAGQVRIGTPANMPSGFYELHFHNNLFTTADFLTIGLNGASNMAPLNIEIQLTSIDLNTSSGIVSANMVQIENAPTIDSVSLTDMFENSISYMTGKILYTSASDSYDYKKQDGATTAFTHTATTSARDVS